LYRQKRREYAGYQPVGPDDEERDGDGNPVIKALTPRDEGRIPISGLKVFLLAIPACCDIAGTTLMNVGLLFVAASIYQMTRGALVLFVGLFSVVFLKRVLHPFQWFALFVVVIGVGIVGLAGALFKDPSPDDRIKADMQGKGMGNLSPAVSTVIGVLLIAFAQVFTATQFVVEEWVLEKYSLEPLKVVGWEGVFGFLVTVLGMAILHFTIGVTPEGQHGYFNAVEGWKEMTNYPKVAISSLAIMVSIGGFNFFGISVTRSISATARSIIDTCRTLFIWIVSLALHWEVSLFWRI
jgi:drug/metabolite transporter (DMT)-like permease